MAKMTSSRPSELLGIEDDPLAAYCWDRAVFTFGSALQGELNRIEAKNQQEAERKQDDILRRWLPDSAVAKTFADPAARRK